jgi:hypothetical protein
MKDQHYAQVNELDNITVSYSHNTHNPYLTPKSLGDIFDRIKEDKELDRIVNAIRSESDKDERRKLKEENLPYFVLGTFENNHRRSDNLISTQFISIDFDDLDGRADELDEKLRADENVFSFFRSPSNNRKVIYKLDRSVTDRKEYSGIYTHFLDGLNSRYGFEADKQTSDAARAIFLSYDPDIYINDDAKPLDTSKVPEQLVTSINLKQVAEDDLKDLPSAIAFLKKVKLGYDEWYKCGLALTQLGEEGEKYFVDMSINEFYQDSLDEIVAKYNHLLDSSQGEITLASLFGIAKENGYKSLKSNNEISVEEKDFTAELTCPPKTDPIVKLGSRRKNNG